MYEKIRFLPSGDCNLIMEFGKEINPQINNQIRKIINLLEKDRIHGLIEWIPTYRSILFTYNPSIVSFNSIIEFLQELENIKDEISFSPPLVTEIPTVYGGEYGPDLTYVAQHNGLSIEDVIAIHSGTDYLIYMLGFTPGFPYLGGMSEKIATARLESPREKITGGSVGIAANQTGIYPIGSPGGWQLIGKTPVRLFDPQLEEPFLLKAGDYLRFVPVNIEEYTEICEKLVTGEYRVKRYPQQRDGERLG